MVFRVCLFGRRRGARSQLTNEKQALRATKTDKARIQKQIDDARAEEMRDSTNEVRERIERTTRAEAERDRLTERLNALHTETAAALDTHKRRDDEAKKKKDELGGIERDIGGKERHLQQLNQQGASPLAAFGQRMPALVQKVRRSRVAAVVVAGVVVVVGRRGGRRRLSWTAFQPARPGACVCVCVWRVSRETSRRRRLLASRCAVMCVTPPACARS